MNISHYYAVNMQQNQLQYAPKRTAFSIKTHCILHQNALHFAPKRTAFCTKTQFNMLQIAIFWC